MGFSISKKTAEGTWEPPSKSYKTAQNAKTTCARTASRQLTHWRVHNKATGEILQAAIQEGGRTKWSKV